MKKKFKIKIIAEAGVNHNGSIKLAKKLIDVAKKANQNLGNKGKSKRQQKRLNRKLKNGRISRDEWTSKTLDI